MPVLSLVGASCQAKDVSTSVPAPPASNTHGPHGVGKAAVAHPERERALPVEDPVSWRYHARHFEPLDFIARLAALVPRPRVNLTRFHGVSPPSRHRARITPAKRGKGENAKAADEPQTQAERRASLTWAPRPKRVFNMDIETCPACGGAMKIIACIEDPVVIQKILDHLKSKDETREPPPKPESRAPPGVLFG